MPSISNTLYFVVVVGAGISVAFQQVLNANLRNQIGSPWWSGSISYIVGVLVMLSMALTSSAPRPVAPATLTGWLFWTGGLFGAIFVGTAIVMIPRLGAATVLALIVVGQMIGSLAFDHFGLLGLPQHSVSPIRLLGVAFLVLGVVLVRR